MPGSCGRRPIQRETLLFTCAGAAHSGQVANRAGIDLALQGAGKLFCVAAVAAEIPDKLERVRKAGARVAIDGCEDHCARRILEKGGVPPDVHVVVTDLGILKQPAEPRMIADARTTAARVMEALSP